MRLTELLCVLAAWTALQLPWERCVSDCHEYLVSALDVQHEHHEHDCGHHDKHDEHQEDVEHERVEFDSPRPVPPNLVLAALPVDGPAVILAAATHGTVRADIVSTVPPEPPPRTTVLLL